MNPMADWIAAHAVLLWALLLMVAVLGADLAWQYNLRWHRRRALHGFAQKVLRWQVGAVLLLALIIFFAAVALAIFGRRATAWLAFDVSLAESLRAQLPVAVLRVIAVITRLGDWLWVTTVAALAQLILLLRRRWQLACAWAVAVLGIVPINGSLKALFHRARPLHDRGFIIEPGWSFPSGHAFSAMVLYGMLAYVLLRLSPRYARTIIAITVLLIGVVGISRIVLQVHYFSDVLAGYTAGGAWLVLCIWVTESLRKPMTTAS